MVDPPRDIWWEYEHDSPAPCTFCRKIFSNPVFEADEFRADGSFEPFNYSEGSEEEPALFCETCKQLRTNPPQWWIDENFREEPYDDSSYSGPSEEAVLRHLEEKAYWEQYFREEAQKREEERYLAFEAPIALGADTVSGQAISVTAEELCAGTYLIGTQGTGKSSLLEQIALQRLEQKDSVIVLDPHGKLVDDLIGTIPSSRHSDTYLLDLHDARNYPFSLNIFSCADPANEIERARTKNRVARVFTRLWPETESGIYANKMLRYATSALIDNPSRTLLDVADWFYESRLPKEFLDNLRDHKTRQFWTRRPRPDQVGPFLDRIDILLEDDVLRRLLCHPEPSLDISQIVRKRQSLLVKLPVDDEVLSYAAKHVGVILFSLVYGMTFSDLPDDGSLGFTLVVDEFQNFVTNEFVKLFVGARKYGAKLVLAHQYIDQLSDEGLSANRRGVQTAGTSVSFQTTPSDARELAPLYAPLEKAWARRNLRIDVAYGLKDHTNEAVKHFAMLRVQPLIEGGRGQLHRTWRTTPDPYFITGGRKVYYENNMTGGGRNYESTQFPTRNFGWGSEEYDPTQARAALEELNDLLYDAQKNQRPDPAKRTNFIKTFARIGMNATAGEIVNREQNLDAELQRVIPELVADPLLQVEGYAARRTVADELLALKPREVFMKTRFGVRKLQTLPLPETSSNEEFSARRKTLLQRTRDAYCYSREQMEDVVRQQPLNDEDPEPPLGRRSPKKK
ncbi:type IV secretory system conjugative DNA transfer family protein [Streptomyces sp. NBC_00366]|uniref:type IV secretory system conjugative DNA transfer family protein n=1 Tax=Streptomyces sp. NBC_00366 TaxID=2975727 RepID=UPI002E26BFBC